MLLSQLLRLELSNSTCECLSTTMKSGALDLDTCAAECLAHVAESANTSKRGSQG